jgi:Uma2 family endonuclease
MAVAAPRSTYAEYLEEVEAGSERRFEFVGGVIRPIADSTPEHSRLAAAVSAELSAALRSKACAVYACSLRIRIDAVDRSTYADATVICGPVRTSAVDPNAAVNPTIIVEVVSPATEASDRGSKWRDYRRLDSLREYVLVSESEPYVDVFRRDGDEWVLRTATAGQMVELPSQGVRLAVDAIYADPRDGRISAG